MQVETYEIEEITNELGVMAADSEAIELIEKLGLKGQQELCTKETDTRFPYAILTSLQALVYETVFPQHTKIENYKSGIIPLRVLQVAAHAKEFDFIKRIQVWHPTDARDRDPVLVAYDSDYGEGGRRYLLARWGDALPAFETLAEKAKKLWVANQKAILSTIQSQVQSEIASLDDIAESAFLGGKAKEYSFYAL